MDQFFHQIQSLSYLFIWKRKKYHRISDFSRTAVTNCFLDLFRLCFERLPLPCRGWKTFLQKSRMTWSMLIWRQPMHTRINHSRNLEAVVVNFNLHNFMLYLIALVNWRRRPWFFRWGSFFSQQGQIISGCRDLLCILFDSHQVLALIDSLYFIGI